MTYKITLINEKLGTITLEEGTEETMMYMFKWYQAHAGFFNGELQLERDERS